MKRFPAARSATAPLLALAVLLGGCSSISGLFSSDKVDYRNNRRAASQPLEVPPDLSQLARDNRYQSQGGVISAAATPAAGNPALAAPASDTPVAPLSAGDVHVMRDGSERWLVVPMSPEQLWPQLKAFWTSAGFTLSVDSPETGVLETDWAENRAKLPQDALRRALGSLIDSAYDTGERDRYRTRVERTATGSEVYISHRGMEEVFTDERKESTVWRPRPANPGLEAEFLSRLMVRLGTKEEVARTAVANAPETPAHARALAASSASLEVDEPFDRAWRRVGLALDRSGFTVEDRDRAGGVYFVRYIDPKDVGKDEPGFWSRLFGGDKGPKGPLRYRVNVKGQGEKTLVSVANDAGAPETGETGQKIVSRLVKELR